MNKRKKASLLYETEISWFILVGSLDVFMTYLILRYSSEGRTRSVMFESNPVARWVLHVWGIRGMVIFKFSMIAIVAVIAEVVGCRRPLVGRLLLVLGVAVGGFVVIYSLMLLLGNM